MMASISLFSLSSTSKSNDVGFLHSFVNARIYRPMDAQFTVENL